MLHDWLFWDTVIILGIVSFIVGHEVDPLRRRLDDLEEKVSKLKDDLENMDGSDL